MVNFTDSFVCEGTRNTGAAVVKGQKDVVWSQALSKRHIGLKREIMALTQALKWAKGSKMEHLHSQYAFATAHVWGQVSKMLN